MLGSWIPASHSLSPPFRLQVANLAGPTAVAILRTGFWEKSILGCEHALVGQQVPRGSSFVATAET